MGTLYLVATPIGNLEDVTQRALRVLSEVALIAAEDTRVALPMLKRFGIPTRVISYHGDSPASRVDEIMDVLQHASVAVISDAGMPGISDPGSELVRAAIERGHPVIPIPGASSVIAAAAVSGVADKGFVFGGFLPRQSGARRKRLRVFRGSWKRSTPSFPARTSPSAVRSPSSTRSGCAALPAQSRVRSTHAASLSSSSNPASKRPSPEICWTPPSPRPCDPARPSARPSTTPSPPPASAAKPSMRARWNCRSRLHANRTPYRPVLIWAACNESSGISS